MALFSEDPSGPAKKVAEKAYDVESVALQGKGWAGHPLHPATVHWPIAFLSTSFGLYAVDGFQTLRRSSVVKGWMPPASSIPLIAYYSGVAGIITAVPSILTGSAEMIDMLKGQAQQKGLKKTLTDAINLNKDDPSSVKARTVLLHAVMNDAISGIAVWNWYVAKGNVTGSLPRVNLLASAVALPALLYSAYLGGSLVYEMAFGVQRQGRGAEFKEKQQKQS